MKKQEIEWNYNKIKFLQVLDTYIENNSIL